MSYLDIPRITVLGTFFTDPSTVNNDPTHYDPDVTRPSPWQTPTGKHHFKLGEATVTSVIDSNGDALFAGDPLLSAAFSTTNLPVPGKIVDLDVYQQAVSKLWGLEIQIQLVAGAALRGRLDPPELNNFNPRRVLPTRGYQAWDSGEDSGYGDDSDASGVFLNLIRVPVESWPADEFSPLLAQLRSRTIQDLNGNYLLSLRLVCDGYKNITWEPGSLTGRFIGTIGPVLSPHEPASAPPARWLLARQINSQTTPWYFPTLYHIPCIFTNRGLNGKTFVADFAGGLVTQFPGGPPIPLGDLTVEWGDSDDQRLQAVQLNESTYNSLGGIVELHVSDEQYLSRKSPLRIRTNREDISPEIPLWAENPSGLAYWAIERGVRLTSEPDSHGSKLQTRVFVTHWGEVEPGIQLRAEVIPAEIGMTMVTVDPRNPARGDTSKAEGCLSASISLTDSYGMATVSLEAVKNPGSRTRQLNSQLYFICVHTTDTPSPNLMKVPWPQERMISAVVWAASEVDKNPDWETVREILLPYVKLYPSMREMIDLSDFHAFQIFATNPPWQAPDGSPIFSPSDPYKLPDGGNIQRGAIPFLLSLPSIDPRFMPITRDLSPNHLLTILYYCYNLQKHIPVSTQELQNLIAKAKGGASN